MSIHTWPVVAAIQQHAWCDINCLISLIRSACKKTEPSMRPKPASNVQLPQGPDVFGYRAPPAGITPSREVLRWVQSLDLSLSLRNARRLVQPWLSTERGCMWLQQSPPPCRDVANGYIVAEIMHRYYPVSLFL